MIYIVVLVSDVQQNVLIIHIQCTCAHLCWTLWPLWSVACWVPLFMGFSRQEYWRGLPFPSPGDLTSPGMEPGSPAWPLGKPHIQIHVSVFQILLPFRLLQSIQ